MTKLTRAKSTNVSHRGEVLEVVVDRLDSLSSESFLEARKTVTQSDRSLIVNAHRGYSLTYPEQTLMAYSQCNAEVFEIDMQTTSDGYAVCFHDDDLSHLTTTGSGAIKDNTLSTVSSLRFTKLQNTRYADMVGIPTLGAVCKMALRRGKKLMAEIKGYRTLEDCTQYQQIIGQYGLNPSTTYICFDMAPLRHIRNINKASSYGLVLASYDSGMDAVIEELASWGGSVIAPSKNILSTIGPDRLRYWEYLGLTITAWTVYTQQELQTVLDYGIRSVTLDREFV